MLGRGCTLDPFTGMNVKAKRGEQQAVYRRGGLIALASLGVGERCVTDSVVIRMKSCFCAPRIWRNV